MLLLTTYHDSKILPFDAGSSLLFKIYIISYCQYAKFHNVVYEKVHLDLLQSFLKIKLKADSQLSKNLWISSVVPSFCAFNHLK